jgi:hypothetical protein
MAPTCSPLGLPEVAPSALVLQRRRHACTLTTHMRTPVLRYSYDLSSSVFAEACVTCLILPPLLSTERRYELVPAVPAVGFLHARQNFPAWMNESRLAGQPPSTSHQGSPLVWSFASGCLQGVTQAHASHVA